MKRLNVTGTDWYAAAWNLLQKEAQSGAKHEAANCERGHEADDIGK